MHKKITTYMYTSGIAKWHSMHFSNRRYSILSIDRGCVILLRRCLPTYLHHCLQVWLVTVTITRTMWISTTILSYYNNVTGWAWPIQTSRSIRGILYRAAFTRPGSSINRKLTSRALIFSNLQLYIYTLVSNTSYYTIPSHQSPNNIY